MSTDLKDFGAHARYMSTAEHKDDCRAWAKGGAGWTARFGRWTFPDPACPGCVTDTDRALWGRLADEVDAWLGRDDQEGLFA